MNNVRIFDDGTRFYVTLENASDEDKQKAMKLVQELFGISRKVETPAGVIPAKVEAPAIPDNSKEIDPDGSITKKKSSNKFIAQITNTEMFIKYYMDYEIMEGTSRTWMLNHCRNYIKKYCKQPESPEMVKKFLVDFEKILEKPITNVLRQKGYSGLSGFLKTADELEVKSLFEQGKRMIYAKLEIAYLGH